jgi:8-oxo-dGTP pyrophosphatase MutT (NUDIX family)
MNEVKSCGVIVFRRDPALEFLLMKHSTRWDLPKGHVDAGESDRECALRELEEETGISARDIELDDQFCFKNLYYVRDRRHPSELSSKTLLVFLAWLQRDVPIQITEHIGYEWIRWNPPHHIQSFTIDPLLAEVEKHFGG